MRKTVQLALMGSLLVAAVSPLAIAGDGPSSAPTPPVLVAGDAVNMVPLPAYEPETQPGPPVRTWSI